MIVGWGGPGNNDLDLRIWDGNTIAVADTDLTNIPIVNGTCVDTHTYQIGTTSSVSGYYPSAYGYADEHYYCWVLAYR